MTNRMLEVVGQVMRGEVKLRGRAARTAPAKKTEASASSPEEPDGSARERPPPDASDHAVSRGANAPLQDASRVLPGRLDSRASFFM
jgi:hypothetical protein